MSAPSSAHEQRVRTFETVAVLAGVTVPVAIGPECLPDLALASADGTVLLVGDAKATETPGCSATARRLTRYLRAVRPLVERGVVVRLAVCHGDVGRVGGWKDQLENLACVARVALVRRATTFALDHGTVVTSVDLCRRRGSEGVLP